jgi:hypothetical protein
VELKLIPLFLTLLELEVEFIDLSFKEFDFVVRIDHLL